MTTQDNLPVWAKVLLGIPVTDEAARDFNRTELASPDYQQIQDVTDRQDYKQSVLVFDPAGRERLWRNMLCPVPGKLRP